MNNKIRNKIYVIIRKIMNSHWRMFYLLLGIIPLIDGSILNTKFVRDYFLHQGVKHIAVFACWDVYGLYGN